MNISKNILDKIFIIIFIIFLFIPIFKIDFGSYSKAENRTLTKLNTIFDFENWINDRFYLRNQLIELNHYIAYKLALRYPHINNRIVDKKTKELNRYAQPPVYRDRLNSDEYQKFITNIQNGLIGFYNFCVQNNIKLYILILPEKESIHHPSVIMNNNDEKIIRFIQEINKDNKLNIIFPIRELQESAKSEYMYFKTDHHLTNDGYFIAYNELMKVIKKDYPEAVILQKNEFNTLFNNDINFVETYSFLKGSLCQTVGLSNDICQNHLDSKYRYYVHKDYKKLTNEKINTKRIRANNFYYKNGYDKRLLLIGNSNTEGICIFIPFSFKYIKKINLNGPIGIARAEQYKIIKYYKNEIIDFKPDIIVLCIGYDTIKHLSDIMEN